MSVDRGFTWMDDETLALIEIWGNDTVQRELGSAKRNFNVYERIARELAEVGFNRTAYQCREKIKRLRKEYQIARYCVDHNFSQKKPMKYYEQVNQVFSRNRFQRGHESRSAVSSDQEDELHFSFNPDLDCDVGSSGNSNFQAMILSSPSTSGDGSLKMRVRMTSEEMSPVCHSNHNDSNDTVVDNEDEDNGASNDLLDDDESPWVPNVVLIENEDHNNSFKERNVKPEVNQVREHNANAFFRATHDRDHTNSEDEPPQKRMKQNFKISWFKTMMDKVTEKFISYQECADSRFLERFVLLERERIKRDESLQKLWIDFEERRRKEEQQHELKMMTIFGQFVSQILKK